MHQSTRMLPAYLESVRRERIAGAVVALRQPLEIEAFQTRDPVPQHVAARAKFRPVRLGWEWGPAWSTCWFRLRGRVPSDSAWRGQAVHLRFSSDTEAQLWVGAEPIQGLDVNRDSAPLFARGQGQRVDVLVEAACNHPFGARGLPWDVPDVQRRWESTTPGRLIAAELVVIDEVAQRLDRLFTLATDLLAQLVPPSVPAHTIDPPWAVRPAPWQDSRAEQLAAALERAASIVGAVAEGAQAGALRAARRQALDILEGALAAGPAHATSVAHAVGHAHIDTAWLWPLRETRRKCIRTFSNALGLMDRHDSFRFLCTQAAQYAMVEQDAPGLFRRIARRVREGRWEAGGAMWVEPDCNVPSAESLIRQIVHAVRHWRERFGTESTAQRHLFLPDTFGFPACLPQIMRLAGLDTFITNKMSWNDTNPFPHTTFVWRGLGSSEVLAHCTPGHDYNASVTPRELRRGDANHRTRELVCADAPNDGPRWLQPFGFGDGGGGPTDEMLLRLDVAARCAGLPRAKHTRVDQFCESLHADVALATARHSGVPRWAGDLYIELHRGTLTTQGWIKRANRAAEDGLRLVEMLAASGSEISSRRRREMHAQRDEAWKLVLLNQFHDILPGSSIAWVYDDARRDHARVQHVIREQLSELVEGERKPSRRATSAQSNAAPGAHVFNPGSGTRREVIELPASSKGKGRAAPRLALTPPVQALSWASVSAAQGGVKGSADFTPVSLAVDEPRRHAILSNGLVTCVVDALGRVSSLRVGADAGIATGADAAAAPLGELVLHNDTPRMWDAWDIDAQDHARFRPETRAAQSWRVTARGPLHAAIEVTRPVGVRSRITQTISLDACSPVVRVACRLEWRERHTLLRAQFPTSVAAPFATFSTQLGHIHRPTHNNTPWEQAAFEVPVQRWMDLSRPGLGLAVLNDCKFGASVDAGTLGLSLVRSPTYPDAEADQGLHEFTWGLVAHDGDWRNAHAEGVEHLAERLHRPFLVVDGLARHTPGPDAVPPMPIVTIDGEDEVRRGISISALKPAEDGSDALVLRLAEVHGRAAEISVRWHQRPREVEAVTVLEEPLERPRARTGTILPPVPNPLRTHDRRRGISRLTLAPFQIATLLARP